MSSKHKIRCKFCGRLSGVVYSQYQVTYIVICKCGQSLMVSKKDIITTPDKTECNEILITSAADDPKILKPGKIKNVIRDKSIEEIENILGKEVFSRKSKPSCGHKVTSKTNLVTRANKNSNSKYFNYKPGWQRPVKATPKPAQKINSPEPGRSSGMGMIRSTDYDDIKSDGIKPRSCPLCGHRYTGGPVCPRRITHFVRKGTKQHRLTLPKDAATRDFLNESHRTHAPLDRD